MERPGVAHAGASIRRHVRCPTPYRPRLEQGDTRDSSGIRATYYEEALPIGLICSAVSAPVEYTSNFPTLNPYPNPTLADPYLATQLNIGDRARLPQVRPGETLDVVWSDPCEAPAVVVWHCGESGPAAVAVRVHMDNMERAGEMIPLADEPSSSSSTDKRSHARRRTADYLLARVRPEGASRTLELNDPPNRWLRTTAGGRDFRANPHDADELPQLTISVSVKSLGLVATEGSGGRQQVVGVRVPLGVRAYNLRRGL